MEDTLLMKSGEIICP